MRPSSFIHLYVKLNSKSKSVLAQTVVCSLIPFSSQVASQISLTLLSTSEHPSKSINSSQASLQLNLDSSFAPFPPDRSRSIKYEENAQLLRIPPPWPGGEGNAYHDHPPSHICPSLLSFFLSFSLLPVSNSQFEHSSSTSYSPTFSFSTKSTESRSPFSFFPSQTIYPHPHQRKPLHPTKQPTASPCPSKS
jgi:hypothetical protein